MLVKETNKSFGSGIDDGKNVSQAISSKIKSSDLIPSEHNNIYNHQHPCMATCFGSFLDHHLANVQY